MYNDGFGVTGSKRNGSGNVPKARWYSSVPGLWEFVQ